MKYNVRFAPSPSGFLHVGGARTAIFNWLIARKSGGKFFLRIEDTDKMRSTADSVKYITEGLQWLGLNWDNEVVFQSKRVKRHTEVIQELLNKGKAYRCFCSKEKLENKKNIAIKNKYNKYYDKECRNLTDSEIKNKLEKNFAYSIRLKVTAGKITFSDIVRGAVTVDANTIDDFIISRADGAPVYQLAVVVDDKDMGINLVLRGEDHLSNTPKQILLYDALEWDIPLYAHVPLIIDSNKKRLSKRSGAVSVQEYQQNGILNNALLNYLSILGWSPKNDREYFTPYDLLKNFKLENITKKPAVFDLKKLEWLNRKHIAELPLSDINPYIKKWLGEHNYCVDPDHKKSFDFFVDLTKKRSKTITELILSLELYFKNPERYEASLLLKYFSHNNDLSYSYLKNYMNSLQIQQTQLFDHMDELEAQLRQCAKQQNISAAKIIHPLRLALTGKGTSIGIFELLHILGKETVLERIHNLLKRINNLRKSEV
jgi:glutamyl-tRNA synthetase